MVSDPSLYSQSALPSMRGGQSSFFSPPHETLDPHTFDGDRMKPEVREFILSTVLAELKAIGLKDADSWLHLWVTGSSMSYMWEASGDMDVTFAASMELLITANPDWAGMSAQQVSSVVKQRFKADEIGRAHV